MERRRRTDERGPQESARAGRQLPARDGGPASAQAALLALQGRAGNAAVSALVAAGRGGRAEDDEDIVPTWDVPMEGEADERSERSIVAQRHHGDDERAEGRARSIVAAPEVQRQHAPTVPKVFPAFNNVQWNETVRNAAWKAWKETLRAATKTTRREQGFWVQWDRTTTANANGTYQVVGAVTGPAVGPAAGATIGLGTKPADSGDWFTVASFHTHTPTRYRKVARVVGPSGADNTADTGDNVTGLVYDYRAVKGGAVPAGHPLWSDATIYHSGPKRRT